MKSYELSIFYYSHSVAVMGTHSFCILYVYVLCIMLCVYFISSKVPTVPSPFHYHIVSDTFIIVMNVRKITDGFNFYIMSKYAHTCQQWMIV